LIKLEAVAVKVVEICGQDYK